MLVTLGDGRTVDAPHGIRRMPPGPVPPVLECEACTPTIVRPTHDPDRPARVSRAGMSVE